MRSVSGVERLGFGKGSSSCVSLSEMGPEAFKFSCVFWLQFEDERRANGRPNEYLRDEVYQFL
jgi:hypothetical protein